MTDQEILTDWSSVHALAVSAMMFYFSIICGFLIAAYTVGKDFTRSQSIYVSSLFVIFALFALWDLSDTFIWPQSMRRSTTLPY